MKLLLAKSIAGHDKERVYVVLGEDGADVLLFDGKYRALDNPKRKRRKHVQLIKHFPPMIAEAASKIDKWTDMDAKRMIRMYKEESEIV